MRDLSGDGGSAIEAGSTSLLTGLLGDIDMATL